MSGDSGLKYTDNRWALDLIQNPSGDADEKKKQHAYHVWREDFRSSMKREDSKISEVNLLWHEVFQLVGFFSVFQGVLFQGVSQLSPKLSCRFYIIPIILSVLSSVATIIAVYVKSSRVQHLRQSLYKEKLVNKVRQSRICACENLGLGFNFEETEKMSAIAGEELRILYNKRLDQGHWITVSVLGTLVIFSSLFAWLIHVIMCGRYWY